MKRRSVSWWALLLFAIPLPARAAGLKVFVSVDMEVLAFLPGVERTDAHSMRFRGRDILEVSRFLQFVTHYEPSLAP